MLEPYRVVELAGYGTAICGQMLGDLGADVIVVEPPDGATLRRRPPYYGDAPHPDRSLAWWATNRNKRGVTLDIESSSGRELFRRLARDADFVLEGLPPGRLQALGLGYEALAAENPRLLLVSTSPFGQDGPKAEFAEADLIVMAASSVLSLTGDEDRPPLHISAPQAALHAGADAAGAALIAHFGRERSGAGQQIDVAAQQALSIATQTTILAAGWQDRGAYVKRFAGGIKLGGATLRLLFPCKDGTVSCTFVFGSAVGPMSRRLMQVAFEHGFAGEDLLQKDYIGFTAKIMTGEESASELVRMQDAIAAFFMSKTKSELFEIARERRLALAPCSTLEDCASSPQLDARGYWVEVDHPELGRSFRYPGPFARLSATPIQYRRRAPLLGEHNAEVYGSLGLGAAELASLRGQGVI